MLDFKQRISLLTDWHLIATAMLLRVSWGAFNNRIQWIETSLIIPRCKVRENDWTATTLQLEITDHLLSPGLTWQRENLIVCAVSRDTAMPVRQNGLLVQILHDVLWWDWYVWSLLVRSNAWSVWVNTRTVRNVLQRKLLPWWSRRNIDLTWSNRATKVISAEAILVWRDDNFNWLRHRRDIALGQSFLDVSRCSLLENVGLWLLIICKFLWFNPTKSLWNHLMTGLYEGISTKSLVQTTAESLLTSRLVIQCILNHRISKTWLLLLCYEGLKPWCHSLRLGWMGKNFWRSNVDRGSHLFQWLPNLWVDKRLRRWRRLYFNRWFYDDLLDFWLKLHNWLRRRVDLLFSF